MRWSDVWILYVRELRMALRERAIVVNGILVPVLLYPLILWMMFSGISFVEGLSERSASRVALFGVPERHLELADSIGALKSVELRSGLVSFDDAADAVRRGELDVAVEFLPPAPEGAALRDNFRVSLVYDRSEDRSRRARARVEEAVERYRERWLEREATAIGAPVAVLEQFRIEEENVATDDEMGALLLGQVIPVLLIIMVALGCFIPAVDTTAGERERSTWETLMTVAAPRSAVVLAKYLYVSTLGVVAGTLNVIAFAASFGAIVAPLASDMGSIPEFRIPMGAAVVLILGAVGLALFFAAAMMTLASFARTFKDGQSMLLPAYYLALVPLLFGQSPDRRLSPETALIPIFNVTQMMRDALVGSISVPLVAETMAVQLGLVALCLWLARQTLRFEDHLTGSYDGSFWTFARSRLLGGRDARMHTGGKA